MGAAIIIPGIRFDAGLGQVTLVGDTAPSSLQIVANDSYVGWKKQLYVRFFPVNTALRSVTWSITSGNAYATIDQNGIITIDEDADNDQIVVRVESNEQHSVYAEKTITVSYTPEITILDKISVFGNPTLNTGIRITDEHDSIEIKYCVIGASAHTGMLFGTLDEYTCAYVEDMTNIIVDFLADNDRNPITKGSILHYKQATIVGREVVDEYFYDKAMRNGVGMTKFSTELYGEGVLPSEDIYLLHPNESYAFAEIEIYYLRFNRSGETVHEFLPASKSGVLGFYDEASDTFITNTGNSGRLAL
jgi:hypothetical protein